MDETPENALVIPTGVLVIPEGEQPLVCNCEDGGDIHLSQEPNGDIMAECNVCLRFRKYPGA